MRRKGPQLTNPFELAARAAAGFHPGLIVCIRPATAFEREDWTDCPSDGLRIHFDEDGTMQQEFDVSAQLPWAGFISLRDWRRLLRAALPGADRRSTSRERGVGSKAPKERG